jgi:hypothetical protein
MVSNERISYSASKRKRPRKQRPRLKSISPKKFNFKKEDLSIIQDDQFNFFEDESVAEEEVQCKNIPAFESKFNFSEIKGNKRDPDDFNLLVDSLPINWTQREKEANKLRMLPKNIRQSKMSTDISPVNHDYSLLALFHYDHL